MSDILQEQLRGFSREIRSLKSNDNSMFDPEKLSIYQSLVLGNLIEVVTPCFPILSEIIAKASWDELMTTFFKESKFTTPIFHELPFELVKYLQNNPLAEYPFAYDLAHYEWLELALELSVKEEESCSLIECDYLSVSWQLSDSARLVAYDYDVHMISKSHLPLKKIPSYYVIYQKEEKVHFMKLETPSFQLLECLLTEKQSPRDVIESLCELFSEFDNAKLLEESTALLALLYETKIIKPEEENKF